MSSKSPNPVDTHVGMRVRLRRVLIGMSQEKLGEQLGITFQQVQKYEKGTNRIGASRLFQIAKTLKVPVSFFYDDMPGSEPQAQAGLAESSPANYVADFISSSEGVQLVKAFLEIRDPRIRRKVVELVQALATGDDGAQHRSSA